MPRVLTYNLVDVLEKLLEIIEKVDSKFEVGSLGDGLRVAKQFCDRRPTDCPEVDEVKDFVFDVVEGGVNVSIADAGVREEEYFVKEDVLVAIFLEFWLHNKFYESLKIKNVLIFVVLGTLFSLLLRLKNA